MNRLQKKCLISAAGLHLLLLVILIVGPAFIAAHTRSETDDLPVLDYVPPILLDAKLSGGGTPNAAPPKPAPVAPPAPQPQPQPDPPKPPEKSFIESVEKIFEPAPKSPPKTDDVIPDMTKKTVKTSTGDSPAPRKNLPDVSLTKVTRNTTSKTPAKTASDSADDSRAKQIALNRAHAAAVDSAIRSLRDGLSTGTTVAIPGPGGAAYANYAQVVKSIYTQNWIAPDDASDDTATAKVSVTIARDGSVSEAHIIKPSGSAAVDRSVRETLNRVRFIAPFPDGATDDERKFIINFNLKAKRLLG